VNDWREPTRGWADRVLPGDGVADLAAILGALDGAGWDGYYDLEIFSDDGTFGNDYPDSLWGAEPGELVRRGREGFARLWEQRRVTARAGTGEEQ
jgi:sugar phosphate isomerase/epimerase